MVHGVMVAAALHGRAEVLDAMERLVGAGPGVMLLGSQGIGRTAVLRAWRELQHEGPTLLIGTHSTASVPFGAFLHMLGDAVDDRTSVETVAARVLAGCRTNALIVDDVHLLDEPSLAVLSIVASQGVRVLLSARTPMTGEPALPPTLRRLMSGLEIRELGPISRTDMASAVADWLPGPRVGGTVDRIVDSSEGNPGFARELVDHNRRTGALQQRDELWAWKQEIQPGPQLSKHLGLRLTSVDPDVHDLLRLVAVGGPIEPPLAKVLQWRAELDPEVRDDALAHRHLRRRNDGALVLQNPCVFEHLVRDLTVEDRRRILLRLKGAADELIDLRIDTSFEHEIRRALWLEELGGGDEKAAAILLAGAKRALSTLDMVVAERLARAAIRAGAEPEARSVLARIDRTSIGASGSDGSGPATRSASPEGSLTTPVDDRDPLHLAQIARAEFDRFAVGVGSAEAAIGASSLAISHLPPCDERNDLEVSIVTARALDGSPMGAVADDLALLIPSLQIPKGRLRAAIMGAPSCALRAMPAEAEQWLRVGDLAMSEAEPDPFLRSLMHLTAGYSKLLLGDTKAVATRVEELDRLAVVHAMPAAPFARFLAGVLATLHGQVDIAIASLADAVHLLGPIDVIGLRTWSAMELRFVRQWASAEPELGEHVAASADDVPAHAQMVRPMIELARCNHLAAAGHLVEASSAAQALVRRCDASGHAAIGLLALHLCARIRPARDHGPLASALAGKHPGPLLERVASHTRALASGIGRDIEDAAEAFALSGNSAFALEAYTAAGAAYRSEAVSSGDRRCTERVRGLREVTRPIVPPAISSVISLTPRERQIAGLAASMSNREIAQHIGLSVRTVESYLHAVYAKLGVNNRSALEERRFDS